ncbi:MAG: hypothetical protein GJ677_00570 [Rhodobacteraceae bacterium]|nr:hypothetical protein [Paracoccaceae bacterium]
MRSSFAFSIAVALAGLTAQPSFASARDVLVDLCPVQLKTVETNLGQPGDGEASAEDAAQAFWQQDFGFTVKGEGKVKDENVLAATASLVFVIDSLIEAIDVTNAHTEADPELASEMTNVIELIDCMKSHEMDLPQEAVWTLRYEELCGYTKTLAAFADEIRTPSTPPNSALSLFETNMNPLMNCGAAFKVALQ